MRSGRTFGRVILRAFVASLIATVIGAELIGLYLSLALSVHGNGSNSIALVLAMLVGAPFLAAPWVIPAGTVAATLFDPLARRIAPEKTPRALAWIMAVGALIGFALLFLFGLGITLFYHVDYPQNPVRTALFVLQIYGPVFGGLTAFGWWLQSPRSVKSSRVTADA